MAVNVNEISDKIKKGTTTVGVICADGVVIGADSRAVLGDFISSDATIKVYKIHDALAVTMAGVAGYAEYIIKVLKVQNEFYRMNEGKPLSPASATSLLSLILRESVSDFGFAFLMVGGLTSKGEPELFSLDAIGATQKEAKYASIGSGMGSALGYLDNAYAPGISVQDGVKHAAKAISVAMKRSTATGGSMKIVAMTKKGFKEYTKEEIEKLLK